MIKKVYDKKSKLSEKYTLSYYEDDVVAMRYILEHQLKDYSRFENIEESRFADVIPMEGEKICIDVSRVSKLELFRKLNKDQDMKEYIKSLPIQRLEHLSGYMAEILQNKNYKVTYKICEIVPKLEY